MGELADSNGYLSPCSRRGTSFQGEVVERVLEWAAGYDEANPDQVTGAKPYAHKLALVLAQDCDLARDWNVRQNQVRIETDFPAVILCPAFPADELRSTAGLTSRRWEIVRQNKDERYAYLAEI